MDRIARIIIAGGKNAAGYPAGTICYDFAGHDYGCAREDTLELGESYNSMTLNADGTGPFFTCAVSALEPPPLPEYIFSDHQRTNEETQS